MEKEKMRKFYEILGRTYSDACMAEDEVAKAKADKMFWYEAYQTTQEAAKKSAEETEQLKAELEKLKRELEQLRDNLAAEAGEGEAV